MVVEYTQSSLPLEVVAAITAAIAVYLDRPLDQFVIKSVTPEGGAPMPSLWLKSGVLEAHLARRQFGIRSR